VFWGHFRIQRVTLKNNGNALEEGSLVKSGSGGGGGGGVILGLLKVVLGCVWVVGGDWVGGGTRGELNLGGNSAKTSKNERRNKGGGVGRNQQFMGWFICGGGRVLGFVWGKNRARITVWGREGTSKKKAQ